MSASDFNLGPEVGVPKISTVDTIYGTMVSYGLGSPISRAAVFGSLGFLIQLLLKPSVSYLSDGRAKAWSVTAGENPGDDTSVFTWWMWPAVGAFIGGFVL